MEATALLVVLLALVLPRGLEGAGCLGAPSAVNAAFPANCSGLPGGSRCAASCNAGYGSRSTPVSVCDGSTGRWGAVTGTCERVCTSPPTTTTNVVWDPTCAGTTPVTGPSSRCSGTCASGTTGSPSIQCLSSGWGLLVGQCSVAPTCPGLPPTVVNAVGWPVSCAGSGAGAVCRATCNSAWQASAPPTSTCVGPSWSTPSPACKLGPAPSPALQPSPSPPLQPSPSPALQPSSSPCPQITVFDNYNLLISASATQTNLSTVWGDFVGLAQPGTLSEFSLAIAVSSTSANLTGGVLHVSIYAWDAATPQALGALLGSFNTPLDFLATGMYSIYTFPDLAGSNISLPSYIAIQQRVSSVTGATRVGTIFSGTTSGTTPSPPTAGTQMTTGFYRDVNSVVSWNNVVGGYIASQLFYRVKIAGC